jgi:hypothetical protein
MYAYMSACAYVWLCVFTYVHANFRVLNVIKLQTHYITEANKTCICLCICTCKSLHACVQIHPCTMHIRTQKDAHADQCLHACMYASSCSCTSACVRACFGPATHRGVVAMHVCHVLCEIHILGFIDPARMRVWQPCVKYCMLTPAHAHACFGKENTIHRRFRGEVAGTYFLGLK